MYVQLHSVGVFWTCYTRILLRIIWAFLVPFCFLVLVHTILLPLDINVTRCDWRPRYSWMYTADCNVPQEYLIHPYIRDKVSQLVTTHCCVWWNAQLIAHFEPIHRHIQYYEGVPLPGRALDSVSCYISWVCGLKKLERSHTRQLPKGYHWQIVWVPTHAINTHLCEMGRLRHTVDKPMTNWFCSF